MTNKFSPAPLFKLLQIIINQYNKQNSIFGIPKELFFKPAATDPFRVNRFGQMLENPIGVAAGPHTQLAQNMVAAWLCGARYFELKTVQTLDNIEVSKPCIDMQDEGYNCEWSQELKIGQSFDQYLDAWMLIHILKHMLYGESENGPGVIFNMSVGYDLEGIKKENVQMFLEKMQHAEVEIAERQNHIKWIYPSIEKLYINPCISNNITLSTMHGCSPDEIERIGRYLLEEKHLHTTIKLNPTLLGKKEVNHLLKISGYDTIVPDSAFEHDLSYPSAIKIINNLSKIALQQNLHFGLKLCNTLESINNKGVFPEKEKIMYMSGAPLHPIAIRLAEKLQNEYKGELDISFSAGIDAFNICDLISCKLYPATVCSDLLKPGGYTRLNQYIENLRDDFKNKEASTIEEYIFTKSGPKIINIKKAALENLRKYAASVENNKDYRKKSIKSPSIKTQKPLGIFDCIHAPCETTCPTNQGIPDYMYYASSSNIDKAMEIILQTNPFPNTTGMVCDHVCQSKCTRINYDNPILIREIKRSISENSEYTDIPGNILKPTNFKVSIIGAGPSGLSCAYFLRLRGFQVNVYETGHEAGGMASKAIPKFRLETNAIKTDIGNILSLGADVFYNQVIDKNKFETLQKSSDYIYIAAGAQKARPFSIPGSHHQSVLNPLEFLYKAKKREFDTTLGTKVLIIGGGNTAMDAARSAKRLLGDKGAVKLIYRRTIAQMPANEEEIKALQEEKIEIQELINPVKINIEDGKIKSLVCQKMKLGNKDAGGRPKPIAIEGSEFEILCDTIIPAVGQEPNLDFIDKTLLKTHEGGFETQLPNVFIGGDALNGGLSVIAAIGDGRKVAQQIINKCGLEYDTKTNSTRIKADYRQLMIKKAKRIKALEKHEIGLDERNNFDLIVKPLNVEETVKEASRCLLCDELCNICTTVCPNLALFAYQAKPFRQADKSGKIIFDLQQETQIIHIVDWCNQCGNCNTFCPTSGAPYKEKPHLFLNKNAFTQSDEGYFFIFTDEEQTILYKAGAEIHSFAENPENYSYITKAFTVQLEKQTFEIQQISKRINDQELNLSKAVEMKVILDGARQFFGV